MWSAHCTCGSFAADARRSRLLDTTLEVPRIIIYSFNSMCKVHTLLKSGNYHS